MANRSSTERKGKAVLEPHHVAAQFPTSRRNGTSLQPLEVKYPNQISLNKAPQNPNANAMNFPSSVLLKNALSSLTETPNSKSPGSSSTAHHANPTTSTNYGNKIHTSSLSTIPTQANNIHLGSVPYPLAQANDGQGGNRSLPRNQRLPGVASELPYSRTGILGPSPAGCQGTVGPVIITGSVPRNVPRSHDSVQRGVVNNQNRQQLLANASMELRRRFPKVQVHGPIRDHDHEKLALATEEAHQWPMIYGHPLRVRANF
ncbi:hypothetical protein Pyn_36240 [Prunus yedoensis var. nudiflora]|uniref:Uncharacterized protein n=1 Tax=Prunus yedoensis var. nudiflora TaxID=2094558 RepID=A0A314UK35_PRUYE|nr:hypothetical protein Pyn_36240 [Prunus yedoensis var. nudiflora]